MNDQKVPTGVGVAVIIIMAVTVGVFVWQIGKDKWKELENPVREIPVVKVEKSSKNNQVGEIEENIDTSDWKTYIDNNQGFEFKYPKDWIVNSENNKLYVYSTKPRESMPEGGGLIIIESNEKNLQGFIKEYELSDAPHTKITKQEDYNLNGVAAVKLTATTAIGINQSIIFAIRGKSYIISFHDFDNDHIKILSTFKFTK